MIKRKPVSYYLEFAIGTITVLTASMLWQDAVSSTIKKDSLKDKYIAAITVTVFAVLFTWLLFSGIRYHSIKF